jgi:hypothetical protein
MKSAGVKSIAEGLRLAPPEERLLKRIVDSSPPGRLAILFQRSLQDSKGVIIAFLLGLAAGLLGWGVSLIERSLYNSGIEILPAIFFAVIIVTLFLRERMVLQSELVKKLYRSLGQGCQNEDEPAEEK